MSQAQPSLRQTPSTPRMTIRNKPPSMLQVNWTSSHHAPGHFTFILRDSMKDTIPMWYIHWLWSFWIWHLFGTALNSCVKHIKRYKFDIRKSCDNLIISNFILKSCDHFWKFEFYIQMSCDYIWIFIFILWSHVILFQILFLCTKRFFFVMPI